MRIAVFVRLGVLLASGVLAVRRWVVIRGLVMDGLDFFGAFDLVLQHIFVSGDVLFHCLATAELALLFGRGDRLALRGLDNRVSEGGDLGHDDAVGGGDPSTGIDMLRRST